METYDLYFVLSTALILKTKIQLTMGISVGNVLISYDVESGHKQVKDAMKELGYEEYWRETTQSPVFQLPNTTLWHSNKSSNQAIADLKGVCTNLRVKLEKAVAVRASEFVGV